MKIGLVGDYDPDVTAHRAIPAAIEIASSEIGVSVSLEWLESTSIGDVKFEEYSGFWGIPASPYKETDNVLSAIKYVRMQNIPYLGTCAGYQHAALEYARNALGYTEAENQETCPDATMPLISALACRLSATGVSVNFTHNSKVQEIYGVDSVVEIYNCGFGVNKNYLSIFDESEMSFVGFDDFGDPRALEIEDLKYFVGVAFQPERSAFLGKSHPLIKAFLKAAKSA
ncbi:MAG: hypothetical protein N839_0016370 [Desulfofustis sp. PB-SRB1]|nr:hypothetical protein [Desulfofustis sp. PB-SRB1]HBH27577.1 hypothetical protein [Desulfofustis sp.]